MGGIDAPGGRRWAAPPGSRFLTTFRNAPFVSHGKRHPHARYVEVRYTSPTRISGLRTAPREINGGTMRDSHRHSGQPPTRLTPYPVGRRWCNATLSDWSAQEPNGLK